MPSCFTPLPPPPAPASPPPQEARVKRVLDRAAAPPFQKIGKPAMFRSTLARKERGGAGPGAGAQGARAADEEEELRAYLEMEG